MYREWDGQTSADNIKCLKKQYFAVECKVQKVLKLLQNLLNSYQVQIMIKHFYHSGYALSLGKGACFRVRKDSLIFLQDTLYGRRVFLGLTGLIPLLELDLALRMGKGVPGGNKKIRECMHVLKLLAC